MHLVLGQLKIGSWELIGNVEERQEADGLAADHQDKYRQIIIVDTDNHVEPTHT